MGENKVKDKKKPSAKIFSIICTVLTAIFAVLTCYVIISVIVAKVQNKPANLFGSSFSIVMTNSMEPEIMTGDLIVFHICDISEVSEDDNIVFFAGEHFGEMRGQTIVHKAINVTEYGIQTKGVNNPSADVDFVTAENFIGICTFNSAFLGALFSFISKYGIFLIIFLIALPIIVTQVIKIIKLSKQSNTDGKEAKAEEENTEELSCPESENTEDKSE